jgi:hypothetical protein
MTTIGLKTSLLSTVASTPAAFLEPIAVGIPDALHMIGIGRTKLHELMNSGQIRAIRVAGRTLIDVASLRALIVSAPDWKATASN